MFVDTKAVIKRYRTDNTMVKRKKEFEDTKGVIRIRQSEKNRKHNDQTKRTK
jgi:hypothetical protein